MAEKIKGIREKLGEDGYKEVIEKEWKTADLPSEEELAKEEQKNPKARNNINSRKNLIQYRKDKPKEVKEKAVNALKYREVEPDVDPEDIFGENVDYKVFENVMPARDVFNDRKEQEIYYHNINLFLKDFDVDELTFSDIEDIISFSRNQVIIYRLLKASRDNPKNTIEASQAIERYQKQTEKIKDNLGSRRRDRVDLKNKQGFSIIDLVADTDADQERRFEEKIKALKEEKEKETPWDPEIG